MFEAAVLDPQLIGVSWVDVDGGQLVTEAVADQGEAGLMLADGGLALALKARVDQRELPGRGGLLGQDAVATAVEVQVLGLVADLCQRRQT